jgi:hypothetical protein
MLCELNEMLNNQKLNLVHNVMVHNEILIGLRILFSTKMKMIITCFILVIIY